MYIVTGGAGLIGSSFIWRLNQAGIDNIIVVDHLGLSEKWKNLRALKFADYFEKDVFLDQVKNGVFDHIEIKGIIHLGACSATTERDASYLVENNFNYSKAMCNFALARGIRFIYASSCATYGDGSQGYLDDESQLEKLRPMNMYGYSKHMFDLWLKRKGLLSQVTGLKFSNIYGPNELHKGEMRSVVCRAFEQISSERTMRLFKSYNPEYPDGGQMRDFLYVKDAVEMMFFLLNRADATGIYNIGSGRAETWNALTDAAFEAFEIEPKIQYIEMPEHLRDRYQYYTKAEIGKLRKLGFSKEITPLRDAVIDYIRNYRIQDKFFGDE
ncbi:MAG: ADP-glyceromanno-heptose 6-epimerase [Victivallaceae bacterium]|nr:ADP-glyceromanno-heptose 6-epimerase [Victivallaceae bacterium]MDD3703035.1 ADP-glyceromanno-heptose 6-epimerase [Victivallaceae bacterium]MDD4316903.1 ADP-glyceromanno-heptose 6-epimerase [Victivallaceae bacterium]NLK82574.1 ADP-glyceromanno-heptose 6-epimerase [Lentisphaerota bacterium]